MKLTRLLWIAAHALIALLPVAGLALGAPDVQLFGVEPPVPPATVSVDRWLAEDAQRDLQKWFESSVGFRGLLVRTDNTLLHATLGETKAGSVVIRGTEDTLFVTDDVWYASKRPQDLPDFSKFVQLAHLTADVQRELARRGKTLVVVISPAKTSIYPEDVPTGWRRRQSAPIAPDVEAYRALRDAFVASGVQFADGRAVLSAAAPQERELLFTRTGRHWTQLGACRVLQHAAPAVWGDLACRYEIQQQPDVSLEVDFDLYRLLNTWHVRDSLPPSPLVLAEQPSVARPRTLFVGTSFTWAAIAVLRPLVRDPHAFFYNNTMFDVSRTETVPLGPVDTSLPSWETYAGDEDLYVLEILEAYAEGSYPSDFLSTLRDRLHATAR